MKIAYKCEGVTVNFFQVLFTAYYAASKDSIKVNSVLTTCNNLPFFMLFELSFISRWNFVVSQVPLWVAPNLITMVGLAVNIGTALILFLCCPTLTEPVKAQIRIRNSCSLCVELGGMCI